MCSTDNEASAVWNERIVRARKPHRCDECHLAIPPGRHYIRIGSLYDGHWETFEKHPECDAVADWVRVHVCEAHGEHGFIPVGGLDEEIHNLRDYGPAMLGPGEAEELEAMGIELTDWEPEGEPDAKRVEFSAIGEWLWDLAKAQYLAPAGEAAGTGEGA